jgi:AcrR family transcriptional regulator
MSAMRKSGSSTKEKILTSAAEIIAATGNSEVNISELAKKAKVSRATIHSTFGPNARTEIYQQILDGLLDSAYRKIQTGLRLAGPEATPIERLVVIFRATMSTFSENRPYGKVVLRQLNVSKSEVTTLSLKSSSKWTRSLRMPLRRNYWPQRSPSQFRKCVKCFSS